MLIDQYGCQKQEVYATLEAVVIRANGKREDLGILGYWWDIDYWRKRAKAKLRKWGFNPNSDVMTYVGFAVTTNCLYQLTLPPKFGGWGTGGSGASAGGTALSTEDYTTTNDGVHNVRVTGTMSQTSDGGQTNDTYKCVALLTAYGSQTITNYGLFDSNGQATNLVTAPSGGNLYVWSSFTGIALATSDAIQFTTKLSYS